MLLQLGFKQWKVKKSKRKYATKGYKKEIDLAVVRAIWKLGPIGFNDIQRTIEGVNYLNDHVSPDTLNSHLERMVKSGDLTKNTEGWRSGKTLPYSLSSKTVQARRLGLYEPKVLTRTMRGMWTSEPTPKRRGLMNIFFILYLMAIKPPLSSGYPHIPYDGLSVSDVLAAINVGHPFGYSKLNEAQINSIIKKLTKEEIIYQTGKNCRRYSLVERKMESFVAELCEFLDTMIIPRIEIGLKNSEEASFEFTSFYDSLYGTKNRMRHFSKFRLLRHRYKDSKNQGKDSKLNETIRLLKYTDYNIHERIHNLRCDHSDLVAQQPFLVEELIECVCPAFLGKNGAGKKYPRMAIANSKSSLKFIGK